MNTTETGKNTMSRIAKQVAYDYTTAGSKNPVIYVKAAESYFNETLTVTVYTEEKTYRVTRGQKKLREQLGDDTDAAEQIIREVVQEVTGMTAEQLGEMPLMLADNRNDMNGCVIALNWEIEQEQESEQEQPETKTEQATSGNRMKKYIVYLHKNGKYQQEIIEATDKKAACRIAAEKFSSAWDIFGVDFKPQLYKAHHPMQGHILIQDYSFELVREVAYKVAERCAADIDIYDEDENIVECTSII